jgi:uncharacterized membrane protein (DUF373 family)/hemoglobin-like flavoprotein
MAMRTFQDIKKNYQFNSEEMAILNSLHPVVEPQADQIVQDFYNYLLQIPDTAKFLDPSRHERLPQIYRTWLLALFQGPFEEHYFQRLRRIGHAHTRIGLSAHFVYVGMNLIRQHLHRVLQDALQGPEQDRAIEATDKILDINLDVIARTYHEEEMRRVFLSQKLDNLLIRFASRFTFGLNLLVLAGLIALSLGVVAVLAHDVSQIFYGQAEKGLVSALGTLLILWLMIELLDSEIERLQGAAFKFNLFIGVALVAFVRKILVATLSHETMEVQVTYLGGIFILGIIFWLVSKAESDRKH